MPGFQLREHTADVGVAAEGDSLADALANLALGMFSVILGGARVEASVEFRVSVSSTDTEALAVDWLNELLYVFQTEELLPQRIEVRVGEDEASLQAVCVGETFDPQRHRLGTEGKAATLHNVRVAQVNGWTVEVVLDI